MMTEKIVSKDRLKFTDKQLIILKLWGELPNEAAIAKELDLSHHTIHTVLRRMREKLNVRRTFDIWKYAKETGLLD